MKAQDIEFNTIKVGDEASFTKTWTETDVDTFATLSGDENPLHTDEIYAKSTQFGQRVVHGMLVASSFSTLVGMYIPGKHCLYLKQSVTFKTPIFIGDELRATGIVTAKSESTRTLIIQTRIFKISDPSKPAIEGEAVVQVLQNSLTHHE